jgi:hypothetical protein
VTTYYYDDGTTSTTTEYVGTTCDGCDGGEYESHCPEDGNGGGIGTEYEYEVARSMKWKVLDDPANPTSSQDIESVERKRVTSEPQGGILLRLHIFGTIVCSVR